MNQTTTNKVMNYLEIYEKFCYAFKSAQTDKEENEAVRTYVKQSTAHGYMLPLHIQGPIKKGLNGWGLRKKDMRVESDPYSAYIWS